MLIKLLEPSAKCHDLGSRSQPYGSALLLWRHEGSLGNIYLPLVPYYLQTVGLLELRHLIEEPSGSYQNYRYFLCGDAFRSFLFP